MFEILHTIEWSSGEMIFGYITTITTIFFGVKSKRLDNKLKKVDILQKLEDFLSNDFEQVHKVNDVLKWRLDLQEEEIKRLQEENIKLKNAES